MVIIISKMMLIEYNSDIEKLNFDIKNCNILYTAKTHL